MNQYKPVQVAEWQQAWPYANIDILSFSLAQK